MPLHSKSPSKSSADKPDNQQQGKNAAQQQSVLQQKINASPQVQHGLALQAMMNASLGGQFNSGTNSLGFRPMGNVKQHTVAQPKLQPLTPRADMTVAHLETFIQKYSEVILPDQKSKLEATNEWTVEMQTDFDTFEEEYGDDEYTEAYGTLTELATKINAVPVAGGGGEAVVLTPLEQTQVINSAWEAKAKAISLATSLAGDDDLIKAEFGVDDGGVAGIKEVINKIKNHLDSLAKVKFLADADGTLLASGAGAVNRSQGAAATMVFTMAFKNTSLEARAATLFHEAGHGTPGITALGIAYVGSWAAEEIKGDSAKSNAPSYERAILATAHNEDNNVPAPERKNLATSVDDAAYIPKLKTTLGKLDHQITQAWWYANNLSNFITTYMGRDIKPQLALNQPKHILWYAQQIGLPVKDEYAGQNKVTSADKEIALIATRVMAKRKNAVDAISQLEKSDGVNPLTIAGGKLTINTVTLGRNYAQIGEAIISYLDTQQGVPDSIKGYTLMTRLSAKKDALEGAAAPRV